MLLRLKSKMVARTLIAAFGANVATNLYFPEILGRVPVLGLSVWAVLFVTMFVRSPDWSVLPETFKGTIFDCACYGSFDDAGR